MTVDEIKLRVEEIRKVAHDDERAHCEEDDLHRDVLSAIADGSAEDPAACAAAALETRSISFARWCA